MIFTFLCYFLGKTKEHHAFRFLPINSPMFRATSGLPAASASASAGDGAVTVVKRSGDTPARVQARQQYALSAAAGPPSSSADFAAGKPPHTNLLLGNTGGAGTGAASGRNGANRRRDSSSRDSSSRSRSFSQLAYVHGLGQWNWTRADFTTASPPSGGNAKMGQMQGTKQSSDIGYRSQCRCRVVMSLQACKRIS